MPGMDGTGPLGQGAMTGGGFGRCNPNADPAVYGGRGMGRGRANRRYSRRGFYRRGIADADIAQPADTIDARTSELEKRLDALSAENERLIKENQKLKENGQN